jgi:hypothetical protein
MTTNEAIKKLNDKIEKIQVQRTKAETKREVLLSRLDSELSKYEKEYGVSLKGKTLKDTIKAISLEQKKVFDDIEGEYNRKLLVVSAIESGNIDEANELLGIKPISEDIDEEPSEEGTLDECVDEVVEEPDEELDEDFDDFSDIATEDVDDFGIDEDDIKKEEFKKPIGSSVDETVKELDDDEDDIYASLDDVDFEDFGFGSILNGTELDV